MCNVVGSSIARETHAGAYTHAGPEIGVASTKAFTTQITVLSLLALKLAQENGALSKTELHEYLAAIEAIPQKIESVLAQNSEIESIAFEYKDASNCLYLGRGYNFPVALEGALKLDSDSLVDCELHLGELDVSLSSVLFKRYEIWSSSTVKIKWEL